MTIKTETKKKIVSKKDYQRRSSADLLLLAIPAMILIFIFHYLPMAGLVIAFKNYSNRLGIFASPWCGLDNFKYLFSSQDAFRIIRNTLGYNFVFIILGHSFAILLAIFLDTINKKNFTKLYQTTFLLPYFISWVVVGYMAKILFDYDMGVLNQVLTAFGRDKIDWYVTQTPWPFMLPLFNIWKSAGYSTIVYYGSIMGIDQEIYEAAEIDGCTGIQKIKYITLPLLVPTAVILGILAIGKVMRADFGLFYYMPNNSGMLYEVTDVIDTYIYRALRLTGNVGVSAAIGFFQSVVGMLLVITVNKIVAKISPDNTLY